MNARKLSVGAAFVAFAAFLACAGEDTAPSAELIGCRGPHATTREGNLLLNPGFEAGHGEPWYSKPSWGTRFGLSSKRVHSGDRSAHLALRSAGSPPGKRVRVYGVVQDLCSKTFPEVVRGHYFVDRWEQGTPRQYLQVVAIVQRAANIPKQASPAPNHQIRYILAGSAEKPTAISNARYRMLSTEAPPVGRWVPFEIELRADFEALWGEVPRSYENLAFFFEARFDGRRPDDGVSTADVYYDDLYLGPAGNE